MKTPLSGRFSLRQTLAGASAALLIFGWLCSLHFMPWVSWHSEALAFLSVWLLALSFMPSPWQARRTAPLPIPGAALLFLGLGVVVFIQAAVGLITFWGDALVLEFYLALCVAALTLGFSWGRTAQAHPQQSAQHRLPDLLQAMAWTLVAGAVASSVVALVQVFDVWENFGWIVRTEYVRRPGANLGQPNQLATLLLMGLASLLYLRERNKLSVVPALLGFILLAIGLAATESRTGVLSSLLLCGWWFVGRSRAGLRLSPWAVVAGVAGFLALFLTWPLLMSSSDNFAPGAEVDARAGMRLVVWPQLLDALSMRPWLGWGLREISKAHNAVASNYSLSEPYTYSHNIGLDLALGLGLPLAGFLIVVVTMWLWRRVRSVRSLAAVLPVAVHSMLEFPFAYAYFLAPTLFLVGVLEAMSGVRPVLRLARWPMAAGLLLVTIAGAWSVVEYLMIEEDFRVARFEALHIGQTPTDYERPKIHLLTQLDALLHGARIVPHPGMTADELELARKVALRFPWPATQNRYALSLALNGNPAEALRQMKVLRALHGEATYLQIKANWETLGNSKYHQLTQIALP
jgi:O-antigen ligase